MSGGLHLLHIPEPATHLSDTLTGPNYDGGLFITPQMQQILDKPGFISVKMGGERLRNMFQKRKPFDFSPFPMTVHSNTQSSPLSFFCPYLHVFLQASAVYSSFFPP